MFGTKHKPSLFRNRSGTQASADVYLTDEALSDDPRVRRICEQEEAFIRGQIDQLPAGSVVADAPCGNGRMSQWVAKRQDLRLVALDYSHNMLKALSGKQLPQLCDSRAQADVMAMPLADKSVDLFINLRLMHHIPDRKMRVDMYREIGRVTRGPIVTSFWTTHCWRYVRRRIRGKAIRGFPISPAEFRSVCADSGLQVDVLTPVRRWYEEQCLVICRSV